MADERLDMEHAYSIGTTLQIEEDNISILSGGDDNRLDDRKLVKMKFLRAARNRMTDELTQSLGAEPVEMCRNVATCH